MRKVRHNPRLPGFVIAAVATSLLSTLLWLQIGAAMGYLRRMEEEYENDIQDR